MLEWGVRECNWISQLCLWIAIAVSYIEMCAIWSGIRISEILMFELILCKLMLKCVTWWQIVWNDVQRINLTGLWICGGWIICILELGKVCFNECQVILIYLSCWDFLKPEFILHHWVFFPFSYSSFFFIMCEDLSTFEISNTVGSEYFSRVDKFVLISNTHFISAE